MGILLVDHAHCERKAALTALHFMGKYPQHPSIQKTMSPLAREELLHFEKVMNILDKREIPFVSLRPSKYAQTLHSYVNKNNPIQRLGDELIIGAIIEARSCERFCAMVPLLEKENIELANFYKSLVRSEARHFENYLKLAKALAGIEQSRVDFFIEVENSLILAEEAVFRFHSGIPI